MSSRSDNPNIVFPQHKSVLLKKLVLLLQPKEKDIFIDCTLGLGGHTKALIEAVCENCTAICIDQDLETLQQTKQNLKAKYKKAQLHFCHDNFSNLDTILSRFNLNSRCVLLADLGISSYQLDNSNRGLSFLKEGPLDMRMNQSDGITAAEYLMQSSNYELTMCFVNFGEIPYKKAKKVANSIKKNLNTLKSTTDLAKLIESNFSKEELRSKNPCAQIFQAIRISINKELNSLEMLLGHSFKLLPIDSLISFISFHSLEDRLVKKFFKFWSQKCVCPKEQLVCNCKEKFPRRLEIMTKKPVLPDQEEIQENSRSRSSKLRIARIIQI